MGATYKADCNDLRNSKSLDVYKILVSKNCSVDIYEPNSEDRNYQKINFIKNPKKNYYDGIIICVDHLIFKRMGLKKIFIYGKKNCKIFDVKNIFPQKNNVIHL